MLNPQAPEFKPTQLAQQKPKDGPQRTNKRQQQRNRKGSKQLANAWWWNQNWQMQMAFWNQMQQMYFASPAAQEDEDELYDDQISDEHLREIMDTDAWVETMCELEDEEREHLTAMALELAPAVGWHLDHDLELVPAEEKEGGLAVVAKPKQKPSQAKGGPKQASKQRRTNKGANKPTTR